MVKRQKQLSTITCQTVARYLQTSMWVDLNKTFQLGVNKIVTGHNADDIAETVIIETYHAFNQ